MSWVVVWDVTVMPMAMKCDDGGGVNAGLKGVDGGCVREKVHARVGEDACEGDNDDTARQR